MKDTVDGQALTDDRQQGLRPGGTAIYEKLTEYQRLEEGLGTRKGSWNSSWGGSEPNLFAIPICWSAQGPPPAWLHLCSGFLLCFSIFLLFGFVVVVLRQRLAM